MLMPKSIPTKEIFRMYRIFPDSHLLFNMAPRGCNTLTIVLSEENQVYCTWTRASQPSVAPLITTTDSYRWNPESMNVRSDGTRMTPSEFYEYSQGLGYKLIKPKVEKPSFTSPLERFERRKPKPEAWSSLEKFNEVFGTDFNSDSEGKDKKK